MSGPKTCPECEEEVMPVGEDRHCPLCGTPLVETWVGPTDPRTQHLTSQLTTDTNLDTNSSDWWTHWVL